jgi:hypothetical protein
LPFRLQTQCWKKRIPAWRQKLFVMVCSFDFFSFFYVTEHL